MLEHIAFFPRPLFLIIYLQIERAQNAVWLQIMPLSVLCVCVYGRARRWCYILLRKIKREKKSQTFFAPSSSSRDQWMEVDFSWQLLRRSMALCLCRSPRWWNVTQACTILLLRQARCWRTDGHSNASDAAIFSPYRTRSRPPHVIPILLWADQTLSSHKAHDLSRPTHFQLRTDGSQPQRPNRDPTIFLLCSLRRQNFNRNQELFCSAMESKAHRLISGTKN